MKKAALKVRLSDLRETVADALVRHIEPLFTNDMRLTLVARHVSKPDCYIVISSDSDLPAVKDTIGRIS